MFWEFSLETVQAYVRTTQRQKWTDPRYARYRIWKGYVRNVANLARVPTNLTEPVKVVIAVFWRRKCRADLDNIVKGVLDALWDQDRLVRHIEAVMCEKNEIESMAVKVQEYDK
jgi:Holliday junction resolvase RusA-like endonuclease